MSECSHQEGKELRSGRICKWAKSGSIETHCTMAEDLCRRNKERFPAPCGRQALLLVPIRYWHKIEISKEFNKHSPKPTPIIKMLRGKIKPYSSIRIMSISTTSKTRRQELLASPCLPRRLLWCQGLRSATGRPSAKGTIAWQLDKISEAR